MFCLNLNDISIVSHLWSVLYPTFLGVKSKLEPGEGSFGHPDSGSGNSGADSRPEGKVVQIWFVMENLILIYLAQSFNTLAIYNSVDIFI
jgi:hypothetical protein